MWLITPTFYDWQADFTARFATENPQGVVERIAMLPCQTGPFSLTIDGVPFQVAVVQLTLARPADTDWFSVNFTYTAPAEAARVVLEVNP